MDQNVTEARRKVLAEQIRDRVRDLRAAIITAREDGLTVQVPQAAHLFFDGGTATGSPDEWIIWKAF